MGANRKDCHSALRWQPRQGPARVLLAGLLHVLAQTGQLVRDYVDAEVVEFYRDMRTFGKDYEAFYERVGTAWGAFHAFRSGYPCRARHDGRLAIIQHRCIYRPATARPWWIWWY